MLALTTFLSACLQDASEPPDAAISGQVELLENCIASRDRKIHEEVFGTVDNPDVQRELLATRKEHAVKECRELYPED